MFLNPKSVVDKGLVKGLYDPSKQIQPNAIDFTVDKIFTFAEQEVITPNVFVISESYKRMRKLEELEASIRLEEDPNQEYWMLAPFSSYDVSSNVSITVEKGMAAQLVLRSTFVRNGLWLSAGLYDSGFSGPIGAVLHTGDVFTYVAKGTRLGQVISIASESYGTYAGGYNSEHGEHWTEAAAKASNG